MKKFYSALLALVVGLVAFPLNGFAADYPEIFGSIIYANSSTGNEMGLYALPTSNSDDFELQFLGPFSAGGGVARDGIYYSTTYSSASGLKVTTTAWDIETGTKIRDYDCTAGVIGHLALDPTTNQVYGITFRPELGGYMLAKINIGRDEITVDRIANLDGYWCAFAIDNLGQFYGIHKTANEAISSITATLYRIDALNGRLTQIGVTGQHPYDNTDACIDPRTNRMFWAVSNPDQGGSLCEVDLKTAYTTTIATFDDAQQVAGLFVKVPDAVPGTPAAVKSPRLNIGKGGYTATLSLDTPEYLFETTNPGTGDLYVSLLVDNDEIEEFKVDWNKHVELDVDLEGFLPGIYNFTVIPRNATGHGPKSYINNIYVGIDSPAAPEATLVNNNGKMELSWSPVTASANGGWFDRDIMTYSVRRLDGTTVASGLTGTSWSETVAEPASITEWAYDVVAVCGKRESAPGRTNSVMLGAMPLPYISSFGTNPDLAYFTVIDGNNDGTVWTVEGNAVKVGYNQYDPMDDWLISPPFKFEAGKPYLLDFTAFAGLSSSPESLEVFLGTDNTAEAMTINLIEKTTFKNKMSDPKVFEAYILPEKTGTYYIGFHGVSDPYMYGLYLNNFSVALSADAAKPAAPVLTVVPAEDGSLKAAIEIVAPDKAIGGDPISKLDKVDLYRGQSLIKSFSNPTPGAKLTYEDVLTASGEQRYSASAFNSEGQGGTATADVYVGFDIPATPANVRIQRTAKEGEALLTWDPVTTDCNGKPLNGNVTYIVNMRIGSKVRVASGLTEPQHLFQAITGDQEFVSCDVLAINAVGQSDIATSEKIPVGTPYEDFAESFPEAMPFNIWDQQKDTDAEVRFEVYNDASGQSASDGDNGFLAFYGEAIGLSARLCSGLISLEDVKNPALAFKLFNNAKDGAPNKNIFRLLGRAADENEWSVIFDNTVDNTIYGAADWAQAYASLSKYEGKVFQLALEGEVVNYKFWFVDDLKVVSLPDNDLVATAISAPANAKTGTEFFVDVTVENRAGLTNNDYKVELYVDDTFRGTFVGEETAPGERKVYSFAHLMPADAEKALTIYAKVVNSKDANSKDNTTYKVSVQPTFSSLPGATNLRVEGLGGGALLKWNAAKSSVEAGQPLTQDFEDAQAFADSYGAWTFVDGDGAPVTGPKGYNIPGVEFGVTAMSFRVWDTDVVPSNDFAANSGSKFLFSLCRKDDGVADDWAISPELDGKAQTVSFFARSAAATFPERVEVLYSEGSTDPADFVSITTAGGKVPAKWTEFKAELPEGAKRFAIRSCAKGALVLLVDDVTFIPADPLAGATLLGYDIYRDNKCINASPVTECKYHDLNTPQGPVYRYSVVAVYDNDVAKPSNTVSFDWTGIEDVEAANAAIFAADGKIVVNGYDGKNVQVAMADGKVVFTGKVGNHFELPVASGIYVVRAGNSTAKLIF